MDDRWGSCRMTVKGEWHISYRCHQCNTVQMDSVYGLSECELEARSRLYEQDGLHAHVRRFEGVKGHLLRKVASN